MTQFQHTLKQLLTGEKTETSRIMKPSSFPAYSLGLMPAPWLAAGQVEHWHYARLDKWRVSFEAGKDYAIEPHRGVRSVGRYIVEKLWIQDVRMLTLGQVEDEGFRDELWCGFWAVWCKMHDPLTWDVFVTPDGFPRSGPEVKAKLMERPPERYQAWRMKIEVLWDTVRWDAPAVQALQIEPKTVE